MSTQAEWFLEQKGNIAQLERMSHSISNLRDRHTASSWNWSKPLSWRICIAQTKEGQELCLVFSTACSKISSIKLATAKLDELANTSTLRTWSPSTQQKFISTKDTPVTLAYLRLDSFWDWMLPSRSLEIKLPFKSSTQFTQTILTWRDTRKEKWSKWSW